MALRNLQLKKYIIHFSPNFHRISRIFHLLDEHAAWGDPIFQPIFPCPRNVVRTFGPIGGRIYEPGSHGGDGVAHHASHGRRPHRIGRPGFNGLPDFATHTARNSKEHQHRRIPSGQWGMHGETFMQFGETVRVWCALFEVNVCKIYAYKLAQIVTFF